METSNVRVQHWADHRQLLGDEHSQHSDKSGFQERMHFSLSVKKRIKKKDARSIPKLTPIRNTL